jgi:anti-anti-sigma regulatory factor
MAGCALSKGKRRVDLKIEKDSRGGNTTVRLIGHFQSEHVGELKKQLQQNGPLFVLDLKEVTVVDVEVVRFLEECEAEGVKIVHCSPYIREWMARERRSQD